MTDITSITESEITLEHVVRALSSSAEPQTAEWIVRQMPRALSANTERILELLVASESRCKVYEFRQPKETRYWYASAEEYARGKLLAKLQVRPCTKTEAVQAVSKLARLQGILSKAAIQRLFASLELNRSILVHPGLLGSRSKLYSCSASDASFYVQDVLERLADRLKISRLQMAECFQKVADWEIESHPPTDHPAEVKASAADHSDRLDGSDERILLAMREINPRIDQGDLVSLTDLRKKLELNFPDKATFDSSILKLARKGFVAVHRFDDDIFLSDVEREALVCDDQGHLYNVASFRLP